MIPTSDMTDSGQPTRPYAGPGATGGNAGRGAEFATGITGATAEPGSESLTIASARYNSQVPTQYRPSSVLQPIMRRSANGMSADTRRWADGTPMGSLNGISESSFEPAAMLRLSGLNAQ
jgi:hypothetical protein